MACPAACDHRKQFLACRMDDHVRARSDAIQTLAARGLNTQQARRLDIPAGCSILRRSSDIDAALGVCLVGRAA
jgi:hypothetical protein